MYAYLEPDLDTTTGLDALGVRLDGDLVRPGDHEWDAARQAWHLSVDQRPAAVVRAASVRDVIETVDAARRLGLRVAPQGTGHNAAPLGPLDGTILLKTSAMRGVAIDPVRKIARVQAGALWMDVVPIAYRHGLTALAGSAPDVGVVGYTLGGGLSWHGRSLGLASDHVTAIELVTALEFRLFEFTSVQAGVLFFPLARAGEVLHAWRDWVQTVPDEVTSVGRMLRFPPVPDLPELLRGQAFVVVEATIRLSEKDADELLAPLRALGPAMDTFATIATSDLGHLHMDPPGPVPGMGDG